MLCLTCSSTEISIGCEGDKAVAVRVAGSGVSTIAFLPAEFDAELLGNGVCEVDHGLPDQLRRLNGDLEMERVSDPPSMLRLALPSFDLL